MKILIVSQYFWPEYFLVNDLALRLKDRGNDVSILTGLPNYPVGRFFKGYSFLKGPWNQDFHGVSVIRVPLVPRGSGFIRLALNYISFVFFGILPGSFRLQDFDVVFCFCPSPVTSVLPAIFFKTIYRKPLVFWVQDLWPESIVAVGATRSKMMLRLIGKLVRFIYSQCDRILIQSKAFEQNIVARGADPKRIHYIPNWSHAMGLVGTTPDWLLNIPDGFKVVFAGNIGKAQAIDTIVNAGERLKGQADIHWLIVGDGSEMDHLVQEVARRGLEEVIHIYGRQPNEDMAALFGLADIALVTLTDEYIFSLTIPSKIQAYMAAGVPILASLRGEGARIVLEAGAGMACDPEDPQALAELVTQFYRMDLGARQYMGKCGQEYFRKNFEENLVIDRIEKICLDLVDRNNK